MPTDSAVCPHCGETIEPRPRRSRKCPHCGQWVYVRGGQLWKEAEANPPKAAPAKEPDRPEESPDVVPEEKGKEEVPGFARFKMFRSTLTPWETVFQHAAEFATRIGPGRVISISHSEDANGTALVTVWYWGEVFENPAEQDEE